MKTSQGAALAILALVGLSACLQQEKIIKLKTDGSGTLHETVVLSKEAAGQMSKHAGPGTSAPEAPRASADARPLQLMDEKKLREAGATLGEGVTFISATPVTTAMGQGYSAVYAFTDINKLKVLQDFGDNTPAGGAPGKSPGQKPARTEPVTFQFARGSPAILTVNLPQPKPVDAPADRPQPQPGGEDMGLMMVQMMFKDLKITFAIEVEGNIARSNADHQDASRVTLVEMDFNKVLANPEKFKALVRAQPKNIEETQALVKGIEGMKAESKPQVTVKFK